MVATLYRPYVALRYALLSTPQYFEVFEVACSMVFAGLLFWQFGNRLIGVGPPSLGDQSDSFLRGKKTKSC